MMNFIICIYIFAISTHKLKKNLVYFQPEGYMQWAYACKPDIFFNNFNIWFTIYGLHLY